MAATVAWTAARPAPPVKALEFPELTRKANPPSPVPPRSSASRSSHQSTGAERVVDRVNTPAIEAPGSIAASITSSRPG